MNAADEESLIEQALRSASHTRLLIARTGVRHETAAVFASQFGDRPAVIVADENTLAAAGRDVGNSLTVARVPTTNPSCIFGPHIYSDDDCARELQGILESSAAIPIAVGSGTINDLTKLAAHRVNRPYMVVATAASMDGYTAFGASITTKGSKQTFDCPAPRAVLADLEVISNAPPEMNAAGYADLVAKIAAGADWIIADELGVDPIDQSAWEIVQKPLRGWIANPAGVRRGDPDSLKNLLDGLIMS